VGLTKPFAKAAVCKSHVIIGCQQADHRRQRFQHIEQTLSFSLHHLIGFLKFSFLRKLILLDICSHSGVLQAEDFGSGDFGGDPTQC
jgi:hypothetical protein